MQGGGYDQGFHEIHPEIWWISPMKSGRFHPDFTCEIHPNYKSKCFSKNSSVWWMQGGGFHPWNPVDFTLKSGGFHPWNLVDFTQISPVKSIQNYKSKCFSKNSSVLMNAGWGLWPRISWNSPWNLVDFTHEIWQISPRFHLWKSTQIIKASVSVKTLQFDECRVGDFTLEIQWISPWNLVDFTHEIWWISPRYHLSNPSKIIKASVSAKTLQFWWMQGGGYDQGFHEIHPEIWWISPMKSGRFHPDFTCEIHPNYKSKCFSKNSSVWWMQGGGFHPWNPVDFTLKSGGFHPWNLVDFTQISPVKSNQNYKSKCFSKNSWVWWMQGGGFLTCEIWQISPRFHLWNPPKL